MVVLVAIVRSRSSRSWKGRDRSHIVKTAAGTTTAWARIVLAVIVIAPTSFPDAKLDASQMSAFYLAIVNVRAGIAVASCSTNGSVT
jgi:hypothetical protein